MIQHSIRGAAAVGVVGALAALTLTSCTNNDDAAAQQAAVDYLAAADAGDHERYCDLSMDGHEDRAKCLSYSRDANDTPGFASAPKAIDVEDWNDGKAVVVEVVLKSNQAAPRYRVLGLVQLDNQWVVAEPGKYLDVRPDETAINQALA